jgi:tetratricopeptide (TPR) repeat protein
MKSISLFDRKFMGGIHGAGGYHFEDSYVLSQLPNWLTLEGLFSFQQELLTDLELFFASGRRWFIQIKKRPVKRNEFVEIIEAFRLREATSSGQYERYIIASPGLPGPLMRFRGHLERFRSAHSYSEAELAQSRRELAAELEGLKCGVEVDFLIEKVFFESEIEWVKQERLLRASFTNSLVKDHGIRQEDAEDIYLRIARLLVVERGNPVELSRLRAALGRRRMEASAQRLSDFELITPEFLDKRSDDSPSYFYDGTVPTWSDITHQRDIPRDIMPEIIARVDHWEHGRALVPILAEAGDGKSTFLHRMAAELARRDKIVLCQKRHRAAISVEEIQSVAEMANQCVYVFIDDAARVQNLKGFIESVAGLPYAIVLIAVSRPYEWIPVRSVYNANLHVEFASDDREWSLEGVTDNEIELLFGRLAEAGLINSLPDEELRPLINSYAERSKRKLLVLVLELTKGRRAAEVLRDECERVRLMGNSVFQAYRYVCLMGSVHSFISRSMLRKVITIESGDADVLRRLQGLVELIGENIYARHDRIAEIVTDILFDGADEERGDALCQIISLAISDAQGEIARRMLEAVYTTVPESQCHKVISHLVNEANLAGETALVGEFFAYRPDESPADAVYDEVLAANTRLILRKLISPTLRNALRAQGHGTENQYTDRSYVWTPASALESLGSSGNSLLNDLGWTEVFARAARWSRWESSHRKGFTLNADKMYEALARIRPGKSTDIAFYHAEFLRETNREKDAIPLYELVVERNPSHVEARAALALCLYFQEDYERALQHYKIARELDWEVIHRYGHAEIFQEMLEGLGDWDELIPLLKSITRFNFDVKRRIQQSDMWKEISLERKLRQSANEAEPGFVKEFSVKVSEEELFVFATQLEDLLKYAKTLPRVRQIELGRSIFKVSFGELRRSDACA